MSPSDKNTFMQWAKRNQNWIPAPVLMELGQLELQNHHPEGLTLFTAGRIRATYDSERCVEKGVQETPIYILLGYRHHNVINYFHEHDDQYINSINEAITWDKNHPYNASPIWVCSYSRAAISFKGNAPQPVSVDSLIKPKEEWPKIREATYARFLKYVQESKNKTQPISTPR